jgi:hypothetical protein
MGINALLRRDRVQTRGKQVEVHVVSMQRMTLWQRARHVNMRTRKFFPGVYIV